MKTQERVSGLLEKGFTLLHREIPMCFPYAGTPSPNWSFSGQGSQRGNPIDINSTEVVRFYDRFDDGGVELVTDHSMSSYFPFRNQLAGYSRDVDTSNAHVRDSPHMRYLMKESGNDLRDFPKFGEEDADSLRVGSKGIIAYKGDLEGMKEAYVMSLQFHRVLGEPTGPVIPAWDFILPHEGYWTSQDELNAKRDSGFTREAIGEGCLITQL